jgi:hypothetical protein
MINEMSGSQYTILNKELGKILLWEPVRSMVLLPAVIEAVQDDDTLVVGARLWVLATVIPPKFSA